MSAYQGITLAILAVVAVGTFMYSYFKSRPQVYDEQPSSHYPNTIPDLLRPPQTSKPSSRRRRISAKASDMCSICLETLANKKKEVKTLTCDHSYHNHCIEMWFAENKTCPVCRR